LNESLKREGTYTERAQGKQGRTNERNSREEDGGAELPTNEAKTNLAIMLINSFSHYCSRKYPFRIYTRNTTSAALKQTSSLLSDQPI
jgi:hypothetical protein